MVIITASIIMHDLSQNPVSDRLIEVNEIRRLSVRKSAKIIFSEHRHGGGTWTPDRDLCSRTQPIL